MKPIKVTLRQRPLENNKISLYLDFYPPIQDPSTGKKKRRDYLGIHIFDNPDTRTQKEYNRICLIKAESIRSQKEIEFLNHNFGFYDKFNQKRDFLQYFISKGKTHSSSAGNSGNWKSASVHLTNYTGGSCTFAEVTPDFCEGFKDYLRTAKSIGRQFKLSTNTQLSYFAKLRAALKDALREKIITSDPCISIQNIRAEGSSRVYLTQDELKKLYQTPCPLHPSLRLASLFSCLTGLRWSDIEKLTWAEVEETDQSDILKFRQKKTGSFEYLPISQQAREILGERKGQHERVFPGLKYSATNNTILKNWILSAGIMKKVTFHCFRHTYATLQLASGTDIYVISGNLGHRELKTTAIYTKITDKKKIEAADKIKLY
ncbi:tyrosine-type recombinase/integrase [Lunatibacter salilacus]|uniref:tyrosine-type recombinase/integrase n=1 Tax=Lunatibacter salilacus TaxID=2483804 RepID=UPI00131C105C|nr:site-specific integrase [Lunatibacter salilacus]